MATGFQLVGADELFVGALNHFDGPGKVGRAYLYSGQTGEKIYPFEGQTPYYLGHSVPDAGDIDNDKVSDLIVGALGQP